MPTCPECGDAFSSTHGVKSHHKQVHGETLSEVPDAESEETDCPTCGQTYASQRAMQVHHAHTHEESLEPPIGCDTLQELYVEQSRPTTEIAERYDTSATTIRKWLDRCDVATRDMSSAKAEGDIQKVQNEQWLREEYIKKKRSASNIAEECGLTTGTVERWLDRHGIEQRTLSEEMAHGNVQSLHERDWLHEQYVEKQRSALEIAEECGVSQGTVTDWLENHDIETRHPSVTQADGEVEPLHDEQWLRTQYWGQSKTASEIASELGVYDSTVNRWLDQHGIEKKGQSVSRAGESVQKLMDSDWLQKQYHDQMKSSVEIGRELGVTSRCVLDWMERHGVERRGREGEDNPMWRGGKEDYYGPSWYSARAEARDRDDCSCQRCGMTDAEHESNYDQKLHVHHIEPFRTFDDPAEANQLDNLITLCRQCHNDLEGLPIDLREIQSSP